MNKIIDAIKTFSAWVGIDGLLHALVNYSIMLAVYPIFSEPCSGMVAAFLVAIVASLGKEVYDIFGDSCTVQHAWHDLLCDALGMSCAVLTWVLWWLCNL